MLCFVPKHTKSLALPYWFLSWRYWYKRRRPVENWKINKKNIDRHSSNASKQRKIDCKHDKSFCMALKLTEDQIADFNMHYWSNRDAVSHRKFLMSHIGVRTPERRRPNQGKIEGTAKNKIICYNVPTSDGVYLCAELHFYLQVY
ncbi:hypothetical protein C0J52_26047 [Blattella germanica]|nr:hypothetical protein C0J52_26047 [Blattella germanica]